MTYEITSERERALLRLLTGEASPEDARELRAALDREPALARRYARLEAVWNGLELPEPEAAPPGFARRVVARLPEEPGGVLGLSGAPAWARAVAALALALGVGAGVFLGQDLEAASTEVETAEEIALVASEPGLADAYQGVLSGDEETP